MNYSEVASLAWRGTVVLGFLMVGTAPLMGSTIHQSTYILALMSYILLGLVWALAQFIGGDA